MLIKDYLCRYGELCHFSGWYKYDLKTFVGLANLPNLSAASG